MNLKSSIICLHISAVLYVLVGGGILYVSIFVIGFDAMMLMMQKILFGIEIITCFVLAGFIEIVVRGLKRHKYWAWIASIIIFGIYIPSIFIVLGIIGLIGILKQDTKKIFVQQEQ